MKWDTISARSRLKVGFKISSTTQNETWLNLWVSLTIFGAISCLVFLFHEHDISSSGLIFSKISWSIRVIWEASSSWRKSNGDKIISPPEEDIFSVKFTSFCLVFSNFIFVFLFSVKVICFFRFRNWIESKIGEKRQKRRFSWKLLRFWYFWRLWDES